MSMSSIPAEADDASFADLTIRSALRTFATERAGLAVMEQALAAKGPDEFGSVFASVVGLLRRIEGRVIVTGMGKSGHIGRKVAATLASTGTAAYFVHPAEASHGDLGMIRSGDAVLAMSWSGETAELADIITYAKRFRIPLLAVTSNPESALGREADLCLRLPRSEEACPNGLAPTTSTTMQLVLGDALAVALLEARGFSATDFKVYHPGGKLGARLTFVRDVMHRGGEIPRVTTRASMEDAIIEMTGKRFGCVAVVDEAGLLVGIITDGDLRRHMGPDLMRRSVEAVMTRRPITIESEALAVEALALLTEKRRSVLIVADTTMHPIGILHLHDLYGIGIG
jgi:arabinose-5-phosphate isomerase